jgi:hypothetical protein
MFSGRRKRGMRVAFKSIHGDLIMAKDWGLATMFCKWLNLLV